MTASSVPDLIVNGRFLTRSMTGVDRVAVELVRAIAAIREARAASDSFRIDVAVPATALGDDDIRQILNLPGESRIIRSRRSGYLWEQLVLPGIEPGSVLLSLCNIGPVTRARQLVLVHDAQIYDFPQSYALSLRLAYRAILPMLGRKAKWFASVSEFSAGRLKANRVATGREIVVLPNGADHMLRVDGDPGTMERHQLSPGGYYLAVGSLARHKNLAMLAEANRLRSDKAVSLVVAGSVDRKVFGETEDLAVKGIRLLGRVSDGELKQLYSNARALLLPSLTEGFGLTALEAMSCGCPVVASDAGAIPEACGNAAVYCPPTEPQRWAECLDGQLSDPLFVEHLTERGAERAQQFTWNATARKLLDALASG